MIAAAAFTLTSAGFALAALSATKTVNIRSTGFAPKNVTIASGDTVRWKNLDTVRHQVVANSGAFASGQLPHNGIYSRRIDTPGTYGYHDALHPTLKGTVKVVGPPPSVSIRASVPIATFGDQIHVAGAITPAAVGDIVSIFAQPSGQMSFVKVAEVQTTTAGVWDFITSPQVLTYYKATWKGKTSATIAVAVAPKLSLVKVGRWFVVHAQPAGSFGGSWIYAQRLNRFGEWVTLKKVPLNRQSAKRFKLKMLPRGMNRVRAFMTTNQAGSGFIFSSSPTLSFRRR